MVDGTESLRWFQHDDVVICGNPQGSSSNSNPLKATARFSTPHGTGEPDGSDEAHGGVLAVSGHTICCCEDGSGETPSVYTEPVDGKY